MATHFREYLDLIVSHAHSKRAVEFSTEVTLDNYGVTADMLQELGSRPYRSKKVSLIDCPKVVLVAWTQHSQVSLE